VAVVTLTYRNKLKLLQGFNEIIGKLMSPHRGSGYKEPEGTLRVSITKGEVGSPKVMHERIPK
jgi:hypothetical protein